MSLVSPLPLSSVFHFLSTASNREEYIYEFRAGLFSAVKWENDPVHIHDSAREYLQRYLKEITLGNQQFQRDIIDYHISRLTALIFFSNRIEDCGLKQTDTFNLIIKIIKDGIITDVDNEQQVNVAAPSSQGNALNKKSSDIRSRNEVIQHAQAYYYLCILHLHDKEGLTESLVLETHKILMNNMNYADQPSRLILAGEYRKTPCNAGWHQFIPVDSVQRCWRDVLHNYNYYKDNKNEQNYTRDPYSLAAYMMYEYRRYISLP